MKQVAVTLFALLAVLVLSTITAADEITARTETVVSEYNSARVNWTRTIEPSVPFSFSTKPFLPAGENPLLEVGQYLWDTSDPTGIMDNVAISGDGSVVAVGVSLNN
jgi:hypothetical protein